MNRRRAFSMIELLVVLGIITILSALLVGTIGHLTRAAKRRQTEQVLANLQGMFADWDTVARVPFGAWALPCPMNVTSALNDVNPNMTAADDSKIGTRYGAVVWLTRDLMFNLRSVANNAAAIDKLPADEKMVIPAGMANTFPTGFGSPPLSPWAASTNYQPATIANPYQLTRAYVPDTTNNTVYVYYDCIQANKSSISNGPPNSAYWMLAYPTFTASGTVASDNSVPVALDGWGNPIIFVPGGTLGLTASFTPDPMSPNGAVDQGTGNMVISGNPIQIHSPDGRPFFASAGPDGDFSLGDDNLYSFEH